MDVQRLLNELCSDFGFCLSGEDQMRIVADPPGSTEAFVDEVIRSEGLDPLRFDAVIRRSMLDRVALLVGEPVWHGRRQYRWDQRRKRT